MDGRYHLLSSSKVSSEIKLQVMTGFELTWGREPVVSVVSVVQANHMWEDLLSSCGWSWGSLELVARYLK